MPSAEFDLIRRFFAGRRVLNSATKLGVGDDCALLSVPLGYQLAVTTDTMVENVHFLPDVDPYSLGYKLLAVNLSDLAAMGAEPVSVTLALTLPKINTTWLEQLVQGFLDLAVVYDIDLIGGDTTSGPLTLTVQAMGLVPEQKALLRSKAQPGDLIFVTGTLGDAGLGLKIAQGYQINAGDQALLRFYRPAPRVQEGLALRNLARSCIDISDGLAQDLGHILEMSAVGASLDWDALPLSDVVKKYIAETGDWQLPLTAGDDYELCFTIAPEQAHLLTGEYTHIGVIEQKRGLNIQRSGVREKLKVTGFEHFSQG